MVARHRVYSKGVDQFARMRRLIFTFVARMQQSQVFLCVGGGRRGNIVSLSLICGLRTGKA